MDRHLREGIELFNRGAYFECHEVLDRNGRAPIPESLRRTCAEPVGSVASLIPETQRQIGERGCALTGFDFPIGVPMFYAREVHIRRLSGASASRGLGRVVGLLQSCQQLHW